MTWRIEPVDPSSDMAALLEVERASFATPWTREMFLWEIENSDVSYVYVIRASPGDVAGYCSFWVIFDELHINNLAVRPAARRVGAGTALLAEVLRCAVVAGATRATLEVRESNAAARQLYERAGFQVSGVRRRYYRNPEEDALVLWKTDLTAGRASDATPQ